MGLRQNRPRSLMRFVIQKDFTEYRTIIHAFVLKLILNESYFKRTIYYEIFIPFSAIVICPLLFNSSNDSGMVINKLYSKRFFEASIFNFMVPKIFYVYFIVSP